MDQLPELDDFEMISCLGYGARSTIYAVSEKKTGQVYALKRVVRKSAEDDRFLEQAEQEYAIASQFDHPALRKCIRMIRRRKMLKTAELFLLMEFFDGTSLDVHRPDNLIKMIQVFVQVAAGLTAVHRLGYVHADIKPNNILVNEKLQAKIIDFGQSCSIGTVKTRIQGTPDYIAPEQVARGPLTPATDVFNFGATMYWCCTDHHIPTLISEKRRPRAAYLYQYARPAAAGSRAQATPRNQSLHPHAFVAADCRLRAKPPVASAARFFDCDSAAGIGVVGDAGGQRPIR